MVAYSNFTPRSDKWTDYKQVSQGTKEFLEAIIKVTGINFGPINPAFLLNEDCSSQYYYVRVTPQTSKDESYCWVKSTSIDGCNKSSIWTKSESHNEIGTGYTFPKLVQISPRWPNHLTLEISLKY